MKRDAILVQAGLAVLATGLLSMLAHAEEAKSSTPYIDRVKRELREKDEKEGQKPSDPSVKEEGPDPYLQSIRKGLKEKAPGATEESYTERLKRELGPAAPSGSYTDAEKARLGDKPTGGAIEAVREGRSELKPRIEGEIHHAAGFRYGASLTRDITAGQGIALRNFNDLYGSNYAPDLTFFYEYQPWHSEWWGSLALFGQVGLAYSHGKGVFQFPVRNPAGGYFPAESRATFQFFTVPLTAGLDYRFNLLRYLRPFVMAGPSLVGYYETANGLGDSHLGNSRGVYFAGGVSVLLDWISRGSSWDLYAEHGVKHYYLTVDYSRLSTFSGEVSFTVSGVYAGLTFEF